MEVMAVNVGAGLDLAPHHSMQSSPELDASFASDSQESPSLPPLASVSNHAYPTGFVPREAPPTALLHVYTKPLTPPPSQGALEAYVSPILGRSDGEFQARGEASGHYQARDPRSNMQPSHASSHSVGSVVGSKRTASGHVKAPSNGLPVSLVTGREYSHSRTTSTTSTGTQISELSTRLRTGLSSAMARYHNAMDKRMIPELVEFVPGDHFTPHVRSPNQGIGFVTGAPPSELRTTLAPSRTLPAFHLASDARSGDYSYTSISMPPAQPLEYPSSKRLSRPSTSHSQPPSLAPPVDFGSREPRRTNPSSHVPLLQPGNSNLSSTSSRSSPSHTSIPATPPPPRGPLQPSLMIPTQKPSTTMEQDAVETLVLMSSPGNSQNYHPNHTGLVGSPLRSNFGQTERQVSWAMDLDSSVATGPRKKGLLDGVMLQDDGKIDEVLDQLARAATDAGGSSDSEDDGVVL